LVSPNIAIMYRGNNGLSTTSVLIEKDTPPVLILSAREAQLSKTKLIFY
jgi:DNA-binding response OmpR family regulator